MVLCFYWPNSRAGECLGVGQVIFLYYHLEIHLLHSQRSELNRSSSVQSLSHVRLFATPWTAARQASLSITNSKFYSNSRPLSLWCHRTISSSVTPFSSCLQSFPASWSFPMSQFFSLGGQSIGASATASVLPMNTQDWFPLEWTGWISSVQGTLKSLLQHHRSKASILWPSAFFIVQHPHLSIHDYRKNHSFE